MSQETILLVAAMAGLAIAITVADLLVSLVRHRKAALPRIEASTSAPVVQERAVDADSRARIKRRLAAIQNAGNEPGPSHQNAGNS